MSINDGLLALYNFHGDARDTSGSGFHGVLTGSPVLTSNQLGESNSAYQFDGTAKWISCVNNPALDVQTLTISAFVSFAALSQNGFIFEKGTVNTQYSLFSEGTNLVFRTKPSSAYHSTIISKSAAGITAIDTWYHIVATYDGALKKIYVNGVKVAEESWALAISVNTGGQWMGAYGGGGAYRLNGKLSSIRVYGRAISDAEVMNLYKIGTGVTSIMSNGELLSHAFDNVGVDTTGLVAMLGLNGNTKDGSGNGNHGILNNAIPFPDQFGNANSAYSFNPLGGHSINLGNVNIGSTDSSIIFMIKSDVTDYGSGGYYHTIYKKENSQMSFYVRSTGLTSIMRVGGALFYHTFSGCFDGNWHCISIVKNSATGLLHYYKDGISTGTAAAAGTLDSFSDHFYYGRTTTSIFDGSLGRMCLFNRALSDGEIAKLSRIMKGQPSMERGKYLSCELDGIHAETSGLQALYNMNGNIKDSSGNGYNGTVNGAILATDKFGNTNSAYSFDGINDYITMGDVLDIGLGNFSYVVRFKTSSVGALTGLLGKTKAAAGGGRYGLLFESGNLTSLCSLGGTMRNVTTSQTPYVDGNWHIAIVTMNRVGNHTLWVDGVNKGSVSISADIAVDSQSTYPFGIGAYQNSTGTAFTQGWLNGMLGPIQIFNRVLTDVEIQNFSKAFLGDMQMIKGRTVVNKFISI